MKRLHVVVLYGVLMGALLWIAPHAYANVCVYKVPKVRHICGMVVDAQGRAIPGASVTLLKDLTPIDELRSKEDGTFSFGLIHTGKYALRMKFAGFSPAEYTITVDRPTGTCERSLRVEMALGGETCFGQIKLTDKRIEGRE